MRILVVYCHPLATSFHARLHDDVVSALRSAGHEVDDCDLYAEDFQPVLSAAERQGYHRVPDNRQPVRDYVERLERAEALVFCFPVWCFGLPAMLKGFFDRVLIPGVAFDLSDPARPRGGLTHLRHVQAVVTYGRPRWTAWLMGDPPRRVITRYLRLLCGGRARIRYHACYHMNTATPQRLSRFRARVSAAMARLAA